jgi:hypothetical protein
VRQDETGQLYREFATVQGGPEQDHLGGFSGIQGEEFAGAVAARFELLRSDRPEALARPEIEDLLSPAGETTFEGPAGGLFNANVALDRIVCPSSRSRAWMDTGSSCASTTLAATGC